MGWRLHSSVQLSLQEPDVHSTDPPVTAILIGLLVMIWPALTKVQWERFPELFSSRRVWIHLAVSFVLNWIVSLSIDFKELMLLIILDAGCTFHHAGSCLGYSS